MHYLSIPTCYFPSTTLFLDNSRDFLLSVVLHLDENVAYRMFDAPLDALDFIHNKQCGVDLLSRHCLGEYTEAKNFPLTNQSINLDLAAIHAELYNPYRFSEISVIVVDDAMPGMDGLEFCRRIENTKIKKILLTGPADENRAIAALNEGLIHRHINKSDENVAQLITKSIDDLQLNYFQSMSDMVLRMLSVHSPSCLQDQKFAHFFRQLCKEKGIIEYYLIDSSGSFLMLDGDAVASFFIVKNTEDMRLYYDLALDHQVDEAVLDLLANGKKIPLFWQGEATNPPWNNWLSCLVDAERFIADETYFYAHVSGNIPFDIHQKKVLSYHCYLEELDVEALFLS